MEADIRDQILSFDDALASLERRGLTLAWQDDAPVLVGPASAKTPELIAVLKSHRAELVEMLRPKPPVEVRWNNGLVERQFPESPLGNGGAWWWRHVGETDWQGVPNTPGARLAPRDTLIPPEEAWPEIQKVAS